MSRYGINYFLLFCLVVVVSACQGTDFGASLERAIAPDMLPAPPVQPSPQPPPTLPADLPDNLPILPDTQLVGVYGKNILHWQSDRSGVEVLQGYESVLKEKGWQIQAISDQQIRAQLGKWEIFLLVDQPDLFLAYVPAIPTAPLPDSWERYSRDVAQLPNLEIKPDLEVSAPVRRREYARWLVRTNNLLFSDRPTRQVRLGEGASPFRDLPSDDPDFPEIMGLVNAGIVARAEEFRPDDPLTRQEMIHLKIPFDLGQSPPLTSRQQVQALWSFQDTDQISDYALRAIAADAQLGDKSNIRRCFGFTTIFRPQQPVTRTEALASLWYFGTPVEGISVGDYNQKPKASPAP